MYSVDRNFLVRENRQFIKDTMKNVSRIEKAMASSEKLSRTTSGNNPPPYVPVVMPGRPLGRATSQPGRRDRLPTSSSTSRRHFSEPLLFANKSGTPKERQFLNGVSSPVLRHRKLLLDRYKQEETQQMSVTRSKVDNYVSDIQLEVQRCRKLRRGVSADDHDVSAPESEADEVKE
ncbi:uncharacterized protein LOC101859952 [Aplysia californica]|uniref:Uncharacterized protein LOC101859952 n=1 Tax=Aplysia californica TaxID=6500 RepID=A0ABM0JWE9_APLCA|nr:uncharacterized protein LOC101859952 [Aplysia californica]